MSGGSVAPMPDTSEDVLGLVSQSYRLKNDRHGTYHGVTACIYLT